MRGKCDNISSLPKLFIQHGSGKEKNGKWRVCVDFTNLNRACSKDCFPLPKIDQLVDSTLGHSHMNFLDAYRGYHQIMMHKPD